MPTNYLLRQWQNSGGLNAQDPQSFASDLQTTLVPRSSAGSSTPTFTRATTAYQTDFEGKLNAVLSGEARFQGARRVRNWLLKTENLLDANWTTINGGTGSLPVITSGQLDPLGGTAAFRLQLNRGAGDAADFSIVRQSGLGSHTNVARSTYIKSNTGSTQTINLQAATGASDRVTAGLTWTRVSSTSNPSGFDFANYGTDLNTRNADILVWHPQYEDTTGQTNQNPSEYVSVGVLSAPYQGSGVDGVQYFQTLNGNTVASNVVTEATGARIVAGQAGVSATAPVDAGGPFGEIDDPSRTEIIAVTADIRDMTTANWTLGATATRARTSVGADGAASSGNRLTGGAVTATNTLTYLVTAAATSRTYSAYVKRVTGTGPIQIVQGATINDISAQLNTSTYTQVSLNASVLNATIGFRVDTNLDAIDIDMNSFVAGGITGSPILTGGGVQAGDVSQYVSSANIPASNNDFTVYGEVVWPVVPSVASYFLWASYVDASNYTAVLWDGTNLIARKRIGGVNHDATKALTPTANTRIKWAARFTSTTGTDIFYSGAIGTNDATNTACQIGAAFQIGADGNGANQPYADNSNSRIYPKALPTSKLTAMTT